MIAAIIWKSIPLDRDNFSGQMSSTIVTILVIVTIVNDPMETGFYIYECHLFTFVA